MSHNNGTVDSHKNCNHQRNIRYYKQNVLHYLITIMKPKYTKIQAKYRKADASSSGDKMFPACWVTLLFQIAFGLQITNLNFCYFYQRYQKLNLEPFTQSTHSTSELAFQPLTDSNIVISERLGFFKHIKWLCEFQVCSLKQSKLVVISIIVLNNVYPTKYSTIFLFFFLPLVPPFKRQQNNSHC